MSGRCIVVVAFVIGALPTSISAQTDNPPNSFCGQIKSIMTQGTRAFYNFRMGPNVGSLDSPEYVSNTVLPGALRCSVQVNYFAKFGCKWEYKMGQTARALQDSRTFSKGIYDCVGGEDSGYYLTDQNLTSDDVRQRVTIVANSRKNWEISVTVFKEDDTLPPELELELEYQVGVDGQP